MNELSEYGQAFRKILPVAVPLALVGLVAGGAYSLSQPKAWEASTTLYVYRTTATKTDVYDFDGYYAQQAAQQYTDTVVGLLKTPDLANRAAQIASVATTPDEILAGIKVRKAAPQLVSLSVTKPTADEAKVELVALAKAASERAEAQTDQFGRSYKVEMVTGQPLVNEASNNLLLNSLIGLLGGGLVGFILSLALQYLHR